MWNVSLRSSYRCPACGKEREPERIVGKGLSWEEAIALGGRMRLPNESIVIWPVGEAPKEKDHR